LSDDLARRVRRRDRRIPRVGDRVYQPALGLLIASPFILTPPGTAIYFLEAGGGQEEALWILRGKHPGD
jgi:hypothetical protein